MNRVRLVARKFTLGIVAAVCCFAFSGCVYEVPITSKPTRKLDERLLGNWTSKDGKNKMKVVRLDDSNYIVSYNGDLFRAYHSDVAKTPFVSVQILDSAKAKLCLFGLEVVWRWQAGGARCQRQGHSG